MTFIIERFRDYISYSNVDKYQINNYKKLFVLAQKKVLRRLDPNHYCNIKKRPGSPK